MSYTGFVVELVFFGECAPRYANKVVVGARMA